MELNDRKKIGILLASVVANIGLDQVTKIIIRQKIKYNSHIQLIGDYFIMTKVENTGAFLSLGANFPDFLRVILLLVLPSIVMVAGLGYIIFNEKARNSIGIPVSFLLGGGIGNLIDRILYGSVTDFLHIDLGGWARTGVFNVADMSIMLGMGLLLVKFVQDNRKQKAEEKAKAEGEAESSSGDPNP